MTKRKTKEIYDSYYYDGRKKKWKKENIAHRPVPKPSKMLVEYWLNKWENTEGYPEQERALNKLFKELIPKNKELEDVLIKVCTLNDFYSTNIYKVLDVAKVIQELNIDKALETNIATPDLIDTLNAKVYEETGRHIYSFASKYFSHHSPEIYPIYDSYVDKLLRYYRDEDHFYDFANEDIQCYCGFFDVIQEFVKYYELMEFNVKDIDKMLWQMGQYHFPKYEQNQI